jgi:hypothetical protein
MTPPAAPNHTAEARASTAPHPHEPRDGPTAAAAGNGSVPPTEHESPLAVLKDLWRELPSLFSDRVELLSLELHRAGLALAQIAVLVVAAAILGVTAWLVLWGTVVALLTLAGVHWLLSLAIVLAINLVAAWLAVARVRRLLPSLKLPATRRHLMTISPSTQPPPEAPFPPTSTPVRPPPPCATPRGPSTTAAAMPAAAGSLTPSDTTKAPAHHRHEPPDLPTAPAAGR